MKDINTYLLELADQLIIDPNKKERIDTSFSHLTKGLWGHFQSRLSNIYTFGSYDRETIVTEDPESDVDVLVAFKQKEVKPDTYLAQLREFCKSNYSRSEIYQDYPTIVIEMDHMKFEITPSYFYSDNIYKIPAPRSKEFSWINTSPKDLKTALDNKDRNNKQLIRLLIRIFKYWNHLNGKVFLSFQMERIIIGKTYSCNTMREYYFSASNAIIESATTTDQKEVCNKLGEHNRRLRALEQAKIPEYIENELTVFLPFLV